jgi:hypothetical protein
VLRVLAYYASRDLVPLYGVYALLFRQHGLSAGQVSSLTAYAAFTLGASRTSMSVLVALSGVPMVAVACAAARWLPGVSETPTDPSAPDR